MSFSPGDLSESQMTIPSDSENYDANHEMSESPPESSGAPMILYSPPTIWGLLRGAAINLLLPFVNGMMLGFGELFANEAAFRLGWSGTKVGHIAWSDPVRERTYPYQLLKGATKLKHLDHEDHSNDRMLIIIQIFPNHRHRVGPGVEMVDDPVERRRRDGSELDMYSRLE